ncbi:MAG: hypothetical protein SVV03_05840 [Candidatus Nanohaloarchaea archaeon]|nr:hypothetical protein [Candidatus Nanohaloarchaea archaeon]
MNFKPAVVVMVLALLIPAVSAHVESGASESSVGGYTIVMEKRPGHPLVGKPTVVHIDTEFPGNVSYEIHEDDGAVVDRGVARETDHGYRIKVIFEDAGNYEMHVAFSQEGKHIGEKEVNLHVEPQQPSPVFWAYVVLFAVAPILLVKLKKG